MGNITHVWVRIPREDPHNYKKMTIEDAKKYAIENALVIAKNGVFFEVNDYSFNPDVESTYTYGFVTGHYTTAPPIDLVPRGTKMWHGSYEYPKTK